MYGRCKLVNASCRLLACSLGKSMETRKQTSPRHGRRIPRDGHARDQKKADSENRRLRKPRLNQNQAHESNVNCGVPGAETCNCSIATIEHPYFITLYFFFRTIFT